MFNLKFKRVLAAALSAACLLTLASCGKTGTNNNSEVVGDIKDEDTVLTIGGKDINYEEYKYFYLNAKSYTDGDDETYWENNDEAVTKLKEDTLNSIAQFRAIEMLADEMNVTLSEEDIANNDETIQSYIDYYGEEEFNNLLKEDHLTLDLFKTINNTLTLDTLLYDALVAEDKLSVDKEAFKEKALGGDYVRAMHILYSDKETAEGILEQAQSATDEEFYELAQSPEDPGMVGNTDGYFFTTGEMVEEFEKASFDLAVGETSGLVESTFGYHIIRRLDITSEYIDEHFDELAESQLMSAYYAYVDEYAKELAESATFAAVYDSLGIDNIK